MKKNIFNYFLISVLLLTSLIIGCKPPTGSDPNAQGDDAKLTKKSFNALELAVKKLATTTATDNAFAAAKTAAEGVVAKYTTVAQLKFSYDEKDKDNILVKEGSDSEFKIKKDEFEKLIAAIKTGAEKKGGSGNDQNKKIKEIKDGLFLADIVKNGDNTITKKGNDKKIVVLKNDNKRFFDLIEYSKVTNKESGESGEFTTANQVEANDHGVFSYMIENGLDAASKLDTWFNEVKKVIENNDAYEKQEKAKKAS